MAILTPTFRGHRPCTALRGTPPPKVGVFFALSSPTSAIAQRMLEEGVPPETVAKYSGRDVSIFRSAERQPLQTAESIAQMRIDASRLLKGILRRNHPLPGEVRAT